MTDPRAGTAETTHGPGPVPAVACNMTAAPDSAEQRLEEYARLFAAAFVSRERTARGIRFRLRADPGVEAWARDLAARENACCAFMANAITVAGEHVFWDATTIDDPAAHAVLDVFYNLPTAGWTDVDTVLQQWAQSTAVPIVITDGTVTRPASDDETHFRRGL